MSGRGKGEAGKGRPAASAAKAGAPRNAPGSQPAAVVMMGVSGCGKSVVGEKVAKALGARFLEGDQMHPPENVEMMAQGIPLDDAHRAGWLDAIGEEIALTAAAGIGIVAACSALKRAYRDRLRRRWPATVFVHLAIDPDTARRRVSGRKGHFMPASLVESQFATLEPLQPDEPGATLDGTRTIEALAVEAARFVESGD